MNKNYEGLFIVKGDLDETREQEMVERLGAYIAKYEGSIIKTDNWGKRKLAYPINKTDEGSYVLMYFSLAPSKLVNLERNLRLDENLLRFLIIKLEEELVAEKLVAETEEK